MEMTRIQITISNTLPNTWEGEQIVRFRSNFSNKWDINLKFQQQKLEVITDNSLKFIPRVWYLQRWKKKLMAEIHREIVVAHRYKIDGNHKFPKYSSLNRNARWRVALGIRRSIATCPIPSLAMKWAAQRDHHREQMFVLLVLHLHRTFRPNDATDVLDGHRLRTVCDNNFTVNFSHTFLCMFNREVWISNCYHERTSVARERRSMQKGFKFSALKFQVDISISFGWGAMRWKRTLLIEPPSYSRFVVLVLQIGK